MKLLQHLFVGGLFMVLAACSVCDDSCSSRCQEYFDSHQTARQGEVKAEQDIINEGYKIYRYDMPPFRTGAWSRYYARNEHFGIEELWGGLTGVPTLAFMKAYNKKMDASLRSRYGEEYLRYRSHLIPGTDAQPYKFD
jgi:hypothetical protein